MQFLRRAVFLATQQNVFNNVHRLLCMEANPKPLRSVKSKSKFNRQQYFVDIKQVRATGGNGGDGSVSFLRLWVNDRAGPDGGHGGNGGHVIFEVSQDVTDLHHIHTCIEADHGERGGSKDLCGKNADNTVVKVPLGTIIRNTEGKIIADLNDPNIMFIAARGGAGGHGNSFFASDIQPTPMICEYGATGETKEYVLEIRSMAHIGLIGLPNAGKSTLLRAITRAKPKVAPYPFTTLRPYVGMVQYDDYEQIAIADLPGLIEDSHKNRGLGIMFLKHAERCSALLFIIDISQVTPWEDLETLRYEIRQFSEKLSQRQAIVIANKIDLPAAQANLETFKEKVDLPVISISAKTGINLSTLLQEIRKLYDKYELDDWNKHPM